VRIVSNTLPLKIVEQSTEFMSLEISEKTIWCVLILACYNPFLEIKIIKENFL